MTDKWAWLALGAVWIYVLWPMQAPPRGRPPMPSYASSDIAYCRGQVRMADDCLPQPRSTPQSTLGE